MQRVSLLIAAAAACVLARPAEARTFPPDQVPPALAPWVPWVLDEAPDRNCPLVAGAPVCVWPSRLALHLEETGGTFVLDATLDRDAVIDLPGGTAWWPQDVMIGDTPAVVIPDGDAPAVRAGPGEVHVRGRFAWKSLPESIRIPPTLARVDLTVGGTPVPFPRRDEALLWVRQREATGEEGDRLDIEVSRKLTDGIPMTLATRLVLRASGRPREVDLGRVLPDGFVAMAVSGDVPARLDAGGRLHAQVRAGTYAIEVSARTDGTAPETFTAPKREPPWPPDETWVFEASDALRQVTVTGAPGIDPSRTALRDDWKRLPAYLLAGGESLTVKTARRGEPEPRPGTLVLDREAWMDVDGRGFTLRDQISGELTSGWRLDLQAPATLGHVAIDGADQLVTTAPGTGRQGVEVRRGQLAVVAESRVDGATRTLPAVGWSEDVQKLSMRLHLAPGWSLLATEGVDQVSGTWIGEWTLLGFLFVLLISLAIGKLTRWYWGILALVALALNYQQPDRPWLTWASLLASTALLSVALPDRLRSAVRLWWWGSVIGLALVAVPFAAWEVRCGLHPQVDRPGLSLGLGFPKYREAVQTATFDNYNPGYGNQANMAAAREEAQGIEQQVARGGNAEDKGAAGFAYGSKIGYGSKGWSRNPRRALQNDPNAVVQTGPGVPGWLWKQWDLRWNGPVDRDHQVRLWLLSPRVNLGLALLRAVLTLLLAVLLVRRGRTTARPSGPAGAGARGAAVAAMVVLALAAVPARASDVPDRSTLDELRARLTRVDACPGPCTSTSKVDIAIRAGTLSLRSEVHAAAIGDWSLPGPAQNWVPAVVTVDGRPAAMALLADGFLHVRLAPGRHVVESTGPLPPMDTLTLELADVPHRVAADAVGWRVEGLREDGRAERSIQLVREMAGRAAAEEGGADREPEVALPPWLVVTRTLDIGIPWLVQTAVHRASPAGSPVVVRVPLLPGESVTDADLRVEAGHVVVSLGRDETDVAWDSALDEQPKLSLAAPKGVPWSEVWVLQCSPIWECRAEGLPPTSHQAGGRWQPVFQPYPGESLALAFERPAGAHGQSVTVDTAELVVRPGTRLAAGTLTVGVRSSQGGVHAFELPAEAKVQYVRVDGREEPIRLEAGRLSVTLKPGGQTVEIAWQQPGGISLLERVPRVGVGEGAVNARVRVELPSDRWLILAGGPSWGPAILFWSTLAAALVLALLLGRVPWSPLRTWQWALLLCGLALVPIPAALVVVGWFLAMQRRGMRERPVRPIAHDFGQLVLVGWTCAALVFLYDAVHAGLLLLPDMQVEGAGSSNGNLVWYADRVAAALPQPWVVSLPRWVWQAAMLAWSLWLAWSLVRWVPWAWRSFSAGGLWLRIRKRRVLDVPPSAPTPAPGP
jgi:hypothetical protein